MKSFVIHQRNFIRLLRQIFFSFQQEEREYYFAIINPIEMSRYSVIRIEQLNNPSSILSINNSFEIE